MDPIYIIIGIFVIGLFIFSFIYLRVNLVRIISVVTPKGEQLEIPLKACPFCGEHHANILEQTINEDGEDITVYALRCLDNNKGCGSMTGFYSTPLEAIEAWNDRVNEN